MKLNIKILLGIIYIICFSILIFTVFSYVDLKDLTNFTFIQEHKASLDSYKNNNQVLLLSIFFIFSTIWVLLLGFGSPLALLGGFIFGKWIGTLISVISFSVGSLLLYSLANLFLKDLIKEKLSWRINKFRDLFNKNELLYFTLFRFTGGGGIPFGIQNVLPVIFNMKSKNYFFATFLGLIPSVFIISSLGSGFEKYISDKQTIIWSEILFEQEIYLPIIGFIIFCILTYFLKRKFFK
ncbi:MAG: DedA family protein [Candidatus Pelagibacter sp. TMED165]|nr:MAG: DedA family protein [Candidatus Pelagibacter sp. TMED165]